MYSGPVNASMSDVGITFTVLAVAVPAVALLAITMVTTVTLIGACTYRRFVPIVRLTFKLYIMQLGACHYGTE